MAKSKATKRKHFNIDASVLHALDALARDSDDSFEELADVAFHELLKKRGRQISLKDALQISVRTVPANDREPRRPRAKA